MLLATNILLPLLLSTSTGMDDEARLPYWEVRDGTVIIRLVQRLPDQTRGFFLARGFKPAEAEVIAQSCVFQSIFKNTSSQSTPAMIQYNLREWTVHLKGQRRGMKTREDWKQEWQARRAAKPAQLAFEWALLPTHQQFGPGDDNWGMSVFNLKPGTEFDLEVVWNRDGRRQSAKLKAVRCAPDLSVEPNSQ